MLEFHVFWARKSNVGADFPFNLTPPEEWDLEVDGDVVCFDGVVSVPAPVFDKIAGTLDPLPFSLSALDRFVITDGSRCLAVDTQGYTYPRYKSYLLSKDEACVLALASS